jgi:hypothetical protein
VSRIQAFTALSSAASRYVDARHAAAGAAPGSPAAVAVADLHTTLVDRRTAHTLAVEGVTADDVNPTVGILTAAASRRRQARRTIGA